MKILLPFNPTGFGSFVVVFSVFLQKYHQGGGCGGSMCILGIDCSRFRVVSKDVVGLRRETVTGTSVHPSSRMSYQ